MKLDDIVNAVSQFLRESPLNEVAELGGMKIFDAPLVAVASARDPLFERLKDDDVAGAQHMSPREWLPEAQAVIVYFLPFSAAVREANRYDGLPAVEWLYGRIEGEKCSVALRNFLLELVRAAGGQAMAPSLDERFAVASRRSNWSERHAAYVAGLGTFSLNRSLITERGAAGRIGSIITDMALAATERPYSAYDEYCSHCGACIHRCPAKAVDESGKDNEVCSEFLNETKRRFAPRYGCGKCQTGVPCEDRAPGRRRGVR